MNVLNKVKEIETDYNITSDKFNIYFVSDWKWLINTVREQQKEIERLQIVEQAYNAYKLAK